MDKAENKPASKTGAGLEGVVAAESSIGDVDGINGVLIYQGLNIHDLAEHSTFEETVYLLWHGRLPKREELEALRRDLAANQKLPREVVELFLARIRAALDALHDQFEGADLLCVAHGGVVYALEREYEVPFERLPNLGGRWLEHHGDRLRMGERVVLVDDDFLTTVPAQI